MKSMCGVKKGGTCSSFWKCDAIIYYFACVNIWYIYFSNTILISVRNWKKNGRKWWKSNEDIVEQKRKKSDNVLNIWKINKASKKNNRKKDRLK